MYLSLVGDRLVVVEALLGVWVRRRLLGRMEVVEVEVLDLVLGSSTRR